MEKQKGYLITMSRGNAIQIEASEITSVLKSIETGQPCVLRQAIFNPSFYVQIQEDMERVEQFTMQFEAARKHNLFDTDCNRGEDQRILPVFEPLKNIFEGSEALKLTD